MMTEQICESHMFSFKNIPSGFSFVILRQAGCACGDLSYKIYRTLIVPNWPKWQSLNPHNFSKNDHR